MVATLGPIEGLGIVIFLYITVVVYRFERSET